MGTRAEKEEFEIRQDINRIGCEKERKIDRISNLPSDVLDDILVKLPIRDAVKTSILSKEWRYKWASLSQFAFDSKCIPGFSRSTAATWGKIRRIVYQYLWNHSYPINKFTFSAYCYKKANHDLYELIRFLSWKGVKEFTLEQYCLTYPLKLPSSLFSFQQLRHLQLMNCKLKLPRAFRGYNSLESLHLERVYIDDDTLESFIMKCPVLERLTLLNIYGCELLKIHGPSLKHFKLDSVFEYVCFNNCPHLTSVDIRLKFEDSKSDDDFESDYSDAESEDYYVDSDDYYVESDDFEFKSDDSDFECYNSDSESDCPNLESDNADVDVDSSDSETDDSDFDIESDNCYSESNEFDIVSDDSDVRSDDSVYHEPLVAFKMLSTLGCLSGLERLSLSTDFLKYLDVIDVMERLPIAYNPLVAVEFSDVNLIDLDMVRVSLSILYRFPNMEELNFSVKYSKNKTSCLEFLNKQFQSEFFYKLQAVRLRYTSGMGAVLEILKFILGHSPLLETVTIIKDGKMTVTEKKLRKTLQWLKKASPQAKVKYQVTGSTICYLF